MLRSRKSKRVSWASDGNLCQVRLFLSEDSPSIVGLGGQDLLQAKKSGHILQSTGLVPDDSLPPGFEGFNPANQLKHRLAQISVTKWMCPPRFILDPNWFVVAGPESKEVEIQSQRELRMLEAIYPRPSAIPPNPAVLPDTEISINDDQRTPLIPITPIEEEDTAGDLPCGSGAPPGASTSSHGPTSSSLEKASSYALNSLANGVAAPGTAVGHQADIASAASAALTALLKSSEPGSLIDSDLLVKILGNPTVLEGLIKPPAAASSSQNVLNSLEASQAVPLTPSPALPMRDPPHFSRTETGPSPTGTSSGPFYYPNSAPQGIRPSSMPPVAAGVAQIAVSYPGSALAKDISYYKSLIQQHGGEKQVETLPSFVNHHNQHPGTGQESAESFRPRDSKPKIMKPCLYFNSPKGCRHGANCAYQHDASLQHRTSSIPEMQSAKRMKIDREIRGSQPYS